MLPSRNAAITLYKQDRETGEFPLEKIDGETFEECTAKLRKQYGSGGYEIITKRKVREGGVLGLFIRKKCELTYRLTQDRVFRSNFPPADAGGRNRDFEQAKQDLLKGLTGDKRPNPDIIELAKLIERKFDTLGARLDSRESAAGPDRDTVPVIHGIEDLLEANEFTAAVRKKIAGRLKSELTLEQLGDETGVHARVRDWIAAMVRTVPAAEPAAPESMGKKPRVIALVGPTGEGKTTTLIKMAAQARKGNKLCLITIDNIRGGATDQFETYAKAMDVPSVNAKSAEEVQRVVSGGEGKFDILFIDTAGCGAFDFETMGKTRQMLELKGIKPEVFLVVSASKKTSDLTAIMGNYDTFKYQAVIVTKLDETPRIGNVISALAEKDKPVAYVTTGQSIKQIKAAEPEDFLQKLSDMKGGDL
ncbi:MAG: hypothetical protein LBS64_04005 [Spirochaetaceae bacterium]|jgi:flagellar biosynthesis protein FlhF|nr:hypothetical protein [Spirochaetaceae bacterium]